MEVHLGKLTEDLLKKQKLNKSQFAVLMNYSKQNINALLKKPDWTCLQVYNASIILQDNLFEKLAQLPKLPKQLVKSNDTDYNHLKIENNYLRGALKDKERIIFLLDKKK